MARAVLGIMVGLLVLAGVVGGGAVTILLHSHTGTGFAIVAGLITALGAWFWAALLALAIEMADSLRELVWAAGGET